MSIWREVGDRVFVRRYETWRSEPFDQNIGVVLGADGAAVIDTRGSHRLADELLTDIRTLTRAPVSAVVNTHFHWDHTWGNARFLPAPIWGHVRCAEQLVERSAASLEHLIGNEPALADELAEVVVTPPTVTVDDAASLDLGDRPLELRHLGLGHTDSDIVVVVQDAGVLFAGDLLENDAPPSFHDAFPIAWAATAARLATFVSGPVVPGHGSLGDRAFAEHQAEALAEIADIGRQAATGLIDEDEAVRRSPFPAEATSVALERIRLEVAGELKPVAGGGPPSSSGSGVGEEVEDRR